MQSSAPEMRSHSQLRRQSEGVRGISVSSVSGTVSGVGGLAVVGVSGRAMQHGTPKFSFVPNSSQMRVPQSVGASPLSVLSPSAARNDKQSVQYKMRATSMQQLISGEVSEISALKALLPREAVDNEKETFQRALHETSEINGWLVQTQSGPRARIFAGNSPHIRNASSTPSPQEMSLGLGVGGAGFDARRAASTGGVSNGRPWSLNRVRNDRIGNIGATAAPASLSARRHTPPDFEGRPSAVLPGAQRPARHMAGLGRLGEQPGRNSRSSIPLGVAGTCMCL